eukprot:c12835_g1_i1.p1 GENE.c12835_g1_i1~~c12835_g1_i1.p1  ORF type:complete len:300 (+),score=51.19 c12835_g1_i1:49-948(+)
MGRLLLLALVGLAACGRPFHRSGELVQDVPSKYHVSVDMRDPSKKFLHSNPQHVRDLEPSGVAIDASEESSHPEFGFSEESGGFDSLSANEEDDGAAHNQSMFGAPGIQVSHQLKLVINDAPNEIESDEPELHQNEFANPLRTTDAHPPRDILAQRLISHPQESDSAVRMSAGNYEISIEDSHVGFLNANRIQIGTSQIGARLERDANSVAKYRIRFCHPFSSRPIILVSTVPASAEGNDHSLGVHQDTFAASVSEVHADHFIVNVVRLDQTPRNSWGQNLMLDWVAMEYGTNYPAHSP